MHTPSLAVSTAAPLMPALRHATAPLHAATEELPLMRNLLATTATLADYHAYLTALHQLYLTVEPLLYAVTAPLTLQQLGVQPKLPALQQDLLALGGDTTWLPPAGWSARMRAVVTDEATALGGLYVLEGATLGGRVIARQLRRQWAEITTPIPFAFLEFRGADQIAAGWQQFGAGLAAAANHDRRQSVTQQQIIAGACVIFAALHDALDECRVH